MARFLFPEWTDTFRKLVGLLLLGAPIYLIAIVAYGVSPEAIRIGYQPKQPVPYSHALHAGELKMDCRYCHTAVEQSPHATVPPESTCMGCHSVIRPTSEKLAPIRAAYPLDAKGNRDPKKPSVPVAWIKVNDLPDYVYFNHSAHVNRGVGCETCHGRIDLMEEVYQAKPLTMGWCLNCHNDPYPNLREPSEVTLMGFKGLSRARGKQLAVRYKINPPTNCSTCHR